MHWNVSASVLDHFQTICKSLWNENIVVCNVTISEEGTMVYRSNASEAWRCTSRSCRCNQLCLVLRAASRCVRVGLKLMQFQKHVHKQRCSVLAVFENYSAWWLTFRRCACIIGNFTAAMVTCNTRLQARARQKQPKIWARPWVCLQISSNVSNPDSQACLVCSCIHPVPLCDKGLLHFVVRGCHKLQPSVCRCELRCLQLW
jgi:hypothetical protein